MSDIQLQLEQAAEKFAETIVGILTSATIEDIIATRIAPRAPRGRKRANVEAVVRYVRANPGVLGKQARKHLKLTRTVWHDAVSHCIAAQLVTRQGDRSGARYWGV